MQKRPYHQGEKQRAGYYRLEKKKCCLSLEGVASPGTHKKRSWYYQMISIESQRVRFQKEVLLVKGGFIYLKEDPNQ